MDATGRGEEAERSPEAGAMPELRGHVAVVTGAASGIGLGLATRFAGEGMKVVLADADEARLEQARDGLLKSGAEAISISCDVSSPDQVEALARQAVSSFGAVHLVCNNAGVAGTAGTVWELDPDAWRWILGTNLLGVVNGIRAFVPLLLDQGEGHVLNTASVAGLVPGVLGDYSVTKHAVVALSEALHYDLALAGSAVGVSVLCPGWVRTGIASSQRTAREAGSDPRREALREVMSQRIAGGMDPAAVADHAVRGIREGKFYILTDTEEWAGALKTRMADILDGRAPGLPAL